MINCTNNHFTGQFESILHSVTNKLHYKKHEIIHEFPSPNLKDVGTDC